MSESTLVRTIIAAVQKKYPQAYVRKLSDRFTRGLPDIMIVVKCDDPDGYDVWIPAILFVETKAKKGKASAIQKAELAAIEKAGGEAIVATNVETVMTKLERMGAYD